MGISTFRATLGCSVVVDFVAFRLLRSLRTSFERWLVENFSCLFLLPACWPWLLLRRRLSKEKQERPLQMRREASPAHGASEASDTPLMPTHHSTVMALATGVAKC